MELAYIIPKNECDFSKTDVRDYAIAQCLLKRGYWLTCWKAVQTNRDCDDFLFSFTSTFKSGYHYAFAIGVEEVTNVLKAFWENGYHIYERKTSDYIEYGFVHSRTEKENEEGIEWLDKWM